MKIVRHHWLLFTALTVRMGQMDMVFHCVKDVLISYTLGLHGEDIMWQVGIVVRGTDL